MPKASQIILIYLIALISFLAIDLVWLGLIARNWYNSKIGFLLARHTNWTAALVFYAMFIAGLLYFAFLPGMETGSIGQILLRSALYGFITYSTYDLTNLATLEGWPVIFSLVDITWGTILCTSLSAITYWLSNLFNLI